MAIFCLRKSKINLHLCFRCLYIKHNKDDYQKYHEILGLPENCSIEAVRKAYIELAKKYHPDSGSAETNVNKFLEIDQAFRNLIEYKKVASFKEKENVIAFDYEEPKRCAPQHRQYLNFDGVGSGTPFQRQKQYEQAKVMQAFENVLKHKANLAHEPDTKDLTDKLAQNIKTKYGFDRLVEDSIQEAMAKGKFDNLSGCGKPLPQQQASNNPYVDFVSHKINEILIENGFTPEWITLQKNIRHDLHNLRHELKTHRSHFGQYPLLENDMLTWEETIKQYEKKVDEINKKIEKYNLVVPIINTQMLQIDLVDEATKILEDDSLCSKDPQASVKSSQTYRREETQTFFGFIESVFIK